MMHIAADPAALNLIRPYPAAFGAYAKKIQDRLLTPAQAKSLLTAAQRDPNEHVLTFAMIGLHTGMRYSSILAIKRDEIDPVLRMIWVNRDKAGERTQPITGELAEYLKQLAETASCESNEEWLFPSARSRTGHAVNVRKAWRRVVKAAGLQNVITPHSLRHTVATNAAHAGMDAATIQAIGGWKTRQMAERYTHAASLFTAMDKLEAQLTVGTITPKLHGRSRKTA